MTIKQNVKQVFNELPDGVELVAATKTRTAEEVLQALESGITIIGENYVQEAERNFEIIGERAKWHFIGYLQKNKVKKAVRLFDMIETVDSIGLAVEIDRRCDQIGKKMPVLIEINSGKEKQKSGVFPEEVEKLLREISQLPNITIKGLMTMGPRFGDPEDSRPYFIETKRIFDHMKQLDLPNIDMRYLSMGMTNSYRVALEEGANMIRMGTRIFGDRDFK
jgi:pyridoxal phosphate enzyme (YggS family)